MIFRQLHNPYIWILDTFTRTLCTIWELGTEDYECQMMSTYPLRNPMIHLYPYLTNIHPCILIIAIINTIAHFSLHQIISSLDRCNSLDANVPEPEDIKVIVTNLAVGAEATFFQWPLPIVSPNFPSILYWVNITITDLVSKPLSQGPSNFPLQATQ